MKGFNGTGSRGKVDICSLASSKRLEYSSTKGQPILEGLRCLASYVDVCFGVFKMPKGHVVTTMDRLISGIEMDKSLLLHQWDPFASCGVPQSGAVRPKAHGTFYGPMVHQ
ncbi:hypothetical protein M0802_000550 [Mischocyttarus mexicanus]|nr:hypothetical protein M0802_000550 [Mischocyttarus mexicanus]